MLFLLVFGYLLVNQTKTSCDTILSEKETAGAKACLVFVIWYDIIAYHGISLCVTDDSRLHRLCKDVGKVQS